MSKKRITFHKAMEEAALLPTHDPKRRQFEEDIAKADETTRQAWLQTLSFNESLRLALLRPQPPPELHQRLAAYASSSPATPPSPAFFAKTAHLRAVGLAAFCSVLVFWAVWWFQRPVDPLQHLATLAMQDHEKKPQMTVQTHQWKTLTQELAPSLPFTLQKPSLLSPLRLVGGRKCKLGKKYVLLSQWKDQQDTYSLFQFRLQDYHIPPHLRPTWITPTHAKKKHACKTLIWSQRDIGYAFVFRLFPPHLQDLLP